MWLYCVLGSCELGPLCGCTVYFGTTVRLYCVLWDHYVAVLGLCELGPLCGCTVNLGRVSWDHCAAVLCTLGRVSWDLSAAVLCTWVV